MTAADSNVQMSHDEGLENSFRICSIVANIAAVLVKRWARKVQGRRFRMHNRTRSHCTRHFRVRKRRSVEDIYNELGPVYFRRAYRMQYSTFKALADELRPYVIHACGQKGGPKRYVPNGPISPDVRLACAIRWFSGGSAYDLMTTYGIGHSDTIRSYWYARRRWMHSLDWSMKKRAQNGVHVKLGSQIWLKKCGQLGCPSWSKLSLTKL